jgi:hypothetical protein
MTLDPSEEAELDARIDAALEKLRKHAETAETKAREARRAYEDAKLERLRPWWWGDNA